MENTNKLGTIESRVEMLMIVSPSTRSNDGVLIEQYMANYHNVSDFRQYARNSDLPKIESITRLRRKIQKAGRCLPVETVLDGRREAECTYGHYFGK